MRAIYKPTGRAQEYALLALNLCRGCAHSCRKCWAAMFAKRCGDSSFHTSQSLRQGVLEQLRPDAVKYSGTDMRVLLCFMTDAYQPIEEQLGATRIALSILREHDVPFEVLTKGGMRAARDFDLYGPNDAFACTLTFLDPARSLEYEPGAALPDSRIAALREAHERGIATWVSLEPCWDPEQSLALIDATHTFVRHYKIGTLNYASSTTNWREYAIRAIQKCEEYGCTYYVKSSLAKHLDGVVYTSTDNRRVQRQVPQQD